MADSGEVSFTLAPQIEEAMRKMLALQVPKIEIKFPNLQIPSPESILEAAQLLAESGWVLNGHMTLRALFFLRDEIRAGGKEAADRLLVEYYHGNDSEEFNQMAEGLLHNPHLQAWHQVLDDCIWAYSQGRYTLVIPASLLVLEGLVAEITSRTNTQETKPPMMWQLERPPEEWTITLSSWLFVETFLKALWKTHKFAESPPGQANRHWIMHGRLPMYGNRTDALRLLTAIDCLGDHRRLADRLSAARLD